MIKNNFFLKDLEQNIKHFITMFLIAITCGILTGLSYIYYTTNIAADSITERYAGSDVEDYEIPENFPKSLENMIQTTHEHVNSFSIITFILGLIFYFNSIINGKWKAFIMIEPFLSTLITFLSLWMIRYIDTSFAYLVIASSGLMYICWFIMISISMYELLKK
tara:strand:- start:1913 stop:2404 length:492 start_codon:yes stop_codon:yes gene_type:complete